MQVMQNKTPTVKRILDFVLSIIIMLVCLPVMLIVGLIIFLTEGRPIFFFHERPGKDGQPFKLIKFRSMCNARDAEGNLLPDGERITNFGNFIRKTSIDELPELINVLRGEMSLVGPRPLLMQYVDRYSPQQFRRHEVLPGITGWAQVNGRNTISWNEKFMLDIWYIDHWSVWLDIKILLLTVWKVISGEGISQAGRATMDEFMGNED